MYSECVVVTTQVEYVFCFIVAIAMSKMLPKEGLKAVKSTSGAMCKSLIDTIQWIDVPNGVKVYQGATESDTHSSIVAIDHCTLLAHYCSLQHCNSQSIELYCMQLTRENSNSIDSNLFISVC